MNGVKAEEKRKICGLKKTQNVDVVVLQRTAKKCTKFNMHAEPLFLLIKSTVLWRSRCRCCPPQWLTNTGQPADRAKFIYKGSRQLLGRKRCDNERRKAAHFFKLNEFVNKASSQKKPFKATNSRFDKRLFSWAFSFGDFSCFSDDNVPLWRGIAICAFLSKAYVTTQASCTCFHCDYIPYCRCFSFTLLSLVISRSHAFKVKPIVVGVYNRGLQVDTYSSRTGLVATTVLPQ